jgi:tRNA pseudouridine55 synthase
VPPAETPFGFINANKPPGITSTAFGSRVRHALGRVPLGHWGTLDPDASGVLVLAVGHATRLLPFLGDGRKTYEFDLVLGSKTETGDASGAVLSSGAVPDNWREELPAVASSLIGSLSQVPPMYSAVKVDGQPLYKRARRGEDVDRPAREVEIFSLRELSCGDDRARLTVECSAGTYVRTLCEEIGRRLGVPAHMDALVRVAAGPFTLDRAIAAESVLADPLACLINPLDVLTLPRIDIRSEDATVFCHGNAVTVSDVIATGEVLITVNGRLLGVGRASDSPAGTTLQPTRVFS